MNSQIRIQVEFENGIRDVKIEQALKKKWLPQLMNDCPSHLFHLTVARHKDKFVFKVTLVSENLVFGYESTSKSFIDGLSAVEKRLLDRLNVSSTNQFKNAALEASMAA